MLFSACPGSASNIKERLKNKKNIIKYFLWSLSCDNSIIPPPPHPPSARVVETVWPVFSPLTNVICSNQPIKLGRAATQKLLHYSQVTATHLYPHCHTIGPSHTATELSLAGAGSFVSVLTRQTCPDPAWVIGWKLVHWHYWYNIITSQPTPNTGSLSTQISVNNNNKNV